MRTISQKELKEILEKHKKWLNDEEGGKRADFRCAYLQNVNLRHVNLRYASLIGSDLRSSDLQKADLQFSILRGSDLRKADLPLSILRGSDLQKADLQFSILNGADLTGADLRYASLQGADLRYTSLQSADLRYASLQGADLRYTSLQSAKLFCTNLKSTERPWFIYMGAIGSRVAETIYVVDCDNVQCGCWNDYKGGTLAEFKARIDEAYPADSENEEYQRYRLEYLSAIKMFESMREAYLKSLGEGQ